MRKESGIVTLKALKNLPEGYYMTHNSKPIDYEMHLIIYKFNDVWFVPTTRYRAERHQIIGVNNAAE